jgi:hypothetical protein
MRESFGIQIHILVHPLNKALVGQDQFQSSNVFILTSFCATAENGLTGVRTNQ